MRDCNGCTRCCELFPDGRGSAVTCPLVGPVAGDQNGCTVRTIEPDPRPARCGEWNCAWREGLVPESLWPRDLGVVLHRPRRDDPHYALTAVAANPMIASFKPEDEAAARGRCAVVLETSSVDLIALEDAGDQRVIDFMGDETPVAIARALLVQK